MNQLQHLRQLLDDFYRGSATPQQVEEIGRLFAEMEHTPDDLESDRRLFEALSSSAADTAPVPDSLDEFVSSAIDRAVTPRRRFRHPILRYAICGVSAAAMIAIVISLGLKFVHPNDLNVEIPGNPPHDKTVASAKLPKQSDDIPQVVEKAPDRPAAVQPGPAPTRRPSAKKENATGMHVISDPSEAEAYTAMALHTLSDKMKYVAEAHKNVDTKLTEISETINNILQ